MLRVLGFFILYLLSVTQVFAAKSGSDNSDRAIMVIYVAPIKIGIANSENYTKILTNTIRTELGKSSQYKLANPELENSIELAKNYNETSLSVEEAARKEAQAVDADLVLISEITLVEKQCRINMRLENIYSKEIIKNKNNRASCSINDLEEKVVELVYQIMRNQIGVTSGKLRLARITSDPPGAMLTINNQYYGNTPLNLKIPIGQVRILMEFEGTDRYAPILVNELIEESKSPFKYHKVFAERNAYLALEITPRLAKVKVDGKDIDIKLLTKLPIEVRKEHLVIISYEGHKPQTLTIPALAPDQEYKKNITLSPNDCDLKIVTNPSQAEVFVKGIKIGTTPLNAQITPGDHQFSIQKPFYYAHEVAFFCAPSTSIKKAISLKRTLYTPGEQKRIDRANKWYLASVSGFGVSAGLAVLSYKKYSDFKKNDKDYSSATDPFQLETLKAQRASSKTQFQNFALGSIATAGVSYLFYHWGKFPDDLKQKNLVTLIPQNNGVTLAWQFGW